MSRNQMADGIRIFPTGAIEREVMNTMPPEEAQWLFYFQARDIVARIKLIDLAEAVWDEGRGNVGAAAFLMDAADYLADRAAFQRCR